MALVWEPSVKPLVRQLNLAAAAEGWKLRNPQCGTKPRMYEDDAHNPA